MHVCYLTVEYPKAGHPHGGIGTFLKGIAHTLIQRNIRVTVVSYGYSTTADEVENNGLLTIYYLKKSTWPVLKFIDYSNRFNRTITAAHRKNPIDIIESPEGGLAFIKKIKGIAYVIRMNGGHHYFAEAERRPLEPRKAWTEKKSFSKADGLIAVSNYTNIRTAHFLGYNAANTAIIPNGIDITKFTPGQQPDIVSHRIVFAGTVCEKKGIRQLVMALPLVIKKYPNTHLLVLGNLKAKDRNTGGLYMDYLQQFIDVSIKDSIHFIGFVDNERLQEYIKSAEICVFPSHMETQGIVAAESMAMEKLTIFGKDGPGPEVVGHKVTGLLCDPHSPADIAEKIMFAFENPSLSNQIAKQGRVWAIEQYDAEKLALKNIEFYNSVKAV